MSEVALIRCETYDFAEVKEAVRRGIELIGGIDQFVKPSEKILLKPNLLSADPPEKCVTTHPSVFRAVAEVFLQGQIQLTWGDSPAMGGMIRTAKKAGILEIAEQLKLEAADFTNGESVFYEQGTQNKKFVIAKGVLDCDGIVSLPKLKTHGLERMTGSIKNQFGCVPGALKGEYHVKIPDAHSFGKMLVDLNNYLKPRLYVMDGIQAMEGNGPRGGKPKQMNVLLFSSDPVALDATVCRIIDLEPEYVPSIIYGKQAGDGVYKESEIKLVGDSLDSFKTPSFDVKKVPIKAFNKQAKGIVAFVNNRLVAKPVINQQICTKCGTCVSICPVSPKAVDWHNGDKEQPPVYQYNDCIRCYCCQELCPDSAIDLKTPALRKFFGLFKR